MPEPLDNTSRMTYVRHMTNTGTLIKRSGWVARTATGTDLNGFRFATFDGKTYTYVGRAFTATDEAAVLAEIAAS